MQHNDTMSLHSNLHTPFSQVCQLVVPYLQLSDQLALRLTNRDTWKFMVPSYPEDPEEMPLDFLTHLDSLFKRMKRGGGFDTPVTINLRGKVGGYVRIYFPSREPMKQEAVFQTWTHHSSIVGRAECLEKAITEIQELFQWYHENNVRDTGTRFVCDSGTPI